MNENQYDVLCTKIRFKDYFRLNSTFTKKNNNDNKIKINSNKKLKFS